MRPRGPAARQQKRYRFPCSRCGEATDAPGNTARLKLRLCRRCYGKGKDRRPRELNNLTGAEWARLSRSVEQYPDTRSEKQREHGACFPLSLAKAQIAIYTKRGDTVLDPFVGVGTTLDACGQLGRKGIGIDLNPKFVGIAKTDLKRAGLSEGQTVLVGDACQLQRYVDAGTVDFLLTSPPYGPLLKNVKGAFAYKWQEHSTLDAIPNPTPYSDKAEDLGNLDYEPFLERIHTCLRQTFAVLRQGAYAAWVVKDFRALKQGLPYVNFHGHLIQRAEATGFTLWDIRVYDQTRYRPLVCLGYPSRNFYLNIGHSYVVVLRKA